MALSEELRIPLGFEGGFPYTVEVEAHADDAPAVRAVDEMFAAGIAAGASDLHVEPFAGGGGGRVRERVDGVLRDVRALPDPLFTRVVARIKLLAGMDIADRRLPQDGRYAVRAEVDARVGSMPTVDGERLAIRLLDTRLRVPELDDLGMPAALLARYRPIVDARSGFVIVCGPTGSGKTTTLYASLQARNVPGQHLCTIEDPVEARLHGVAQVQINERAGLTFATALRAFLRQDPDVVMIGEMRDAETAKAAISAGLAGQMVLTTLHSSDAVGAIARLRELGVAPRMLANAVTGILAQRLLRRFCDACKRAADRPASRATACERCAGSGYRGRTPIFEFVEFSTAIRDAVAREAAADEVRALALAEGYEPLAAAARRLVASGQTGTAEARRVLDWAAL